MITFIMMQFDQRRPHVPHREKEEFFSISGTSQHRTSQHGLKVYWTNFSSCAHGLGQLITFGEDLTDGTFHNIPEDLRDTNGDLKLLQALQGPEKRSTELRYFSEYSCKVCAVQ
jgi:hypothetical protein